MRRILYGCFDPDAYAIVDKRIMTNTETGEKIDKKYWMPSHFSSDTFSYKDSEYDIYWRKDNVEVYDDFDLNDEPEEGYELVYQNNLRKIFRRICK